MNPTRLTAIGLIIIAMIVLTAPDPADEAARAVKMLLILGTPALLITYLITRAS